MAIKVNTEMKLTQRFINEIPVGATIYTNGDGNITMPEFFEATIVSKSESLLLLKRRDGETGSGPDGTWIVRATPEKRVTVYVPEEVEGVPMLPTHLKLGDIFLFQNPESIHAMTKFVFLRQTSSDMVLCVPLNMLMQTANIVTIPLAEMPNVLYYGKKPFLMCGQHNCHKPATVATTSPTITLFCEAHRPEDLIECPDCGNIIRISHSLSWLPNARSTSTIRLCSRCAESRRIATQVIQSHSYKPVPKFIRVAPMTDDLRSRLYAGCECEVECPRNTQPDEDDEPVDVDLGRVLTIRAPLSRTEHRMRLAKIIYNRFNKPAKWFYLKSDGSLSNGFELVTEPATIEAHQKMLPWKKVFAFMKAQKIDADNTNTCGLHIHVNKGDLSEEHRIRLGYFVNSQKTKMEALARRTASEYARFKPITSPLEHFSVNTLGGKYEALNWNPPHTVEFRLFKGTIDYLNLMSSLELAEACILFTATAEIEELKKKTATWTKFKDFTQHNGFVYLPDYMVQREVA